jgi:GT2 family glycosyltransferase
LEASISLAPIVLFTYNRPWHLKKTIKSLEKNKLSSESSIYFICDGPKPKASQEELNRIRKVRSLVVKKYKFKSQHCIIRDSNLGLANNVISGISQIINEHDKIIVLEDDLLTSRDFLTYMNMALDKYENQKEVMQISGFQFPIPFDENTPDTFFLSLTTSWGWATWKRAWDRFDAKAQGWEELKTNHMLKSKFDLDESYPYSTMLANQMEHHTVDSWAIRWWWSVFKLQGVCLFPKSSLIKNIGFDKYSTHTKNSPFPEIILQKKKTRWELSNFHGANHHIFSKIQLYLKNPTNGRKPSKTSQLLNCVLKSFK